MARRQFALGDADEACEARLGCKQVVVVRIEAAVGDAIADRKQLALPIEQKAEIHIIDQLMSARHTAPEAGRTGRRLPSPRTGSRRSRHPQGDRPRCAPRTDAPEPRWRLRTCLAGPRYVGIRLVKSAQVPCSQVPLWYRRRAAPPRASMSRRCVDGPRPLRTDRPPT